MSPSQFCLPFHRDEVVMKADLVEEETYDP